MKKVLTALLSIILFFSFLIVAFAGGDPFVDKNVKMVTYAQEQNSAEVTYAGVNNSEQVDDLEEQKKLYDEGLISWIFKNYVIENFKSENKLTADEIVIFDLINKTDDVSDICNLLKMYQGSQYYDQVFKLTQEVSCGTRYQVLDKKLYIFYLDGTIGVVEGNIDIPLEIISDYTGIHSENWQNNVNIILKDDKVIIFDAGCN